MSTFPRSATGAIDLASIHANEAMKVRRAMSWTLPSVIGFVYVTFPTKNYYWDGISFATSIESSSGLTNSLVHPHHLLYNVLGYLIYQLAHAFGSNARAVHVLQFSNCILAACCAWLLFRFLLRTFDSLYLSSLLTLGFAFSSTWWKYATDADAYVPAVLGLLVCLNLIFASPKVRPVSIGLAHAVSMCFHQLAVFFYPVVLIGLLVQQRLPLRERFRLALQYSVVASGVTLATNYYCFHSQTGAFGVSAFFRWLTAYLQGPERYSLSFDLLSALRYTLRGQVRLFFEGRFTWLQGLLSVPVILLVGVLIAIALLLLVQTARELRSIKFRTLLPQTAARKGFQTPFLKNNRFKPLMYFCSAWILVYLIFLALWYPYFTPYRLFYLPPILCLIGVVINRSTDSKRHLLALLVAGMALSNFLFFIYPMMHSRNYPPLAFALQLNDAWQPGSTVFYARSNADNQLVRYFNPSTEWKFLDADKQDVIEGSLEGVYQTGKSAWLETSAIDQILSSTEGATWLVSHTRPECSHKLVNDKFRLEFVQIFPSATIAKQPPGCTP